MEQADILIQNSKAIDDLNSTIKDLQTHYDAILKELSQNVANLASTCISSEDDIRA